MESADGQYAGRARLAAHGISGFIGAMTSVAGRLKSIVYSGLRQLCARVIFFGRSKVDGVLNPAEAPKGKGLYFMDTSSAAAEAATLFAAGGSVTHLFTTGQGNIIGNPVIPVIKMSANP